MLNKKKAFLLNNNGQKFNFLRNNRGQESAPFELLIAVIVMTFVMFVGMNALAKLHTEECDYKIQKNLQDLEFALEKTVNQAVPQKLSFSPPSCYKNQRVFLQYKENKNMCSDICQVEKERCIILNFFSDDGSNYRRCIDIAISTLFQQTGDCPPQGETGTPLNLQTGGCTGGGPSSGGTECNETDVIGGTYIFKNNTKAGDPFPTICAYKVK